MCGAEIQPLPEGVQRVARVLLDRGHPHGPVLLDAAARTAQQAADALGMALGQLEPLVCLIDRSLSRFGGIWAAAGRPHAMFRLKPADLGRLIDGAAVADVLLEPASVSIPPATSTAPAR